VLDRNALVLLDDEFALLGDDIETRRFTAQAIRLQFELDAFLERWKVSIMKKPARICSGV
jgi:hypothetical protein